MGYAPQSDWAKPLSGWNRDGGFQPDACDWHLLGHTFALSDSYSIGQARIRDVVM
jgi:hypothetical protein